MRGEAVAHRSTEGRKNSQMRSLKKFSANLNSETSSYTLSYSVNTLTKLLSLSKK